jgi:hypothetical protein
MNHCIKYLIFLALILAFPTSGAWADDDKSWVENIKIEFGLTAILQSTSGNDFGENTDQADYAYSADLAFIGAIAQNQTLNVVIEAGEGDGANDNLGSRTAANYDSFISNFEGETRTNVSQAYYEARFMDDKVTIAFGKMDHHSLTDGNEYAGNETSQFINGLFVRSAGVVFAESKNYYAPTFALFINPIDIASVIYTYSKHDTEDVFTEGDYVVELTISPKLGELQGNYRIAYFSNGGDSTDHNNGDTKSNSGINISMDQAVTENIGLFLRYASQDDSLSENEVTSSISGGVSIGGGMWGRDGDNVGIAYGHLTLNEELVTQNNEGESVVEAYYRYEVNEHMAITADAQLYTDLERDDKRDVTVFGIRMQAGF